MKRYLPFIIILAVAMLTAGGGIVLYRAKQHPPTEGSGITDGQSGISPQHVRGGSKPRVTLEEFGDFQCPPCAATTLDSIAPLEKEYGERLRVIFWEFPLDMHEHARAAAKAAEAASLQGRFWEMHDILYKNQNTWSKAPDVRALFDAYAQELHLDLERFKKDSDSAEVAARVDRQREYGVTRGAKNTPTIFINHRVFDPPFTPERMREAVEKEMSGQKES